MIVHGAGPFGHALVEMILSGASIDVPDVHRSMLVLNEAVNAILRNRGMNPITLSPMDYVDYDEDFSTKNLVHGMTRATDSGKLPVSHGDIVRARVQSGRLGEYEVISGDRVASDLAIGWRADSVIMVTDTDGVLDRDPAIAMGRRIPRIGYQECLDLLRGRGAKGADVTGGIAQKVVSCREPILSGIPLKIISGLTPGNLLSATEDADVGTTIRPG
jgi:isopentenyl phosphate kinase